MFCKLHPSAVLLLLLSYIVFHGFISYRIQGLNISLPKSFILSAMYCWGVECGIVSLYFVPLATSTNSFNSCSFLKPLAHEKISKNLNLVES